MLLLDPLTCMAAAIYFEARGEKPLYQAMVANTIINRKVSKRYPNTVCGVVKQKHQFSFYWDGKPEVVNDKKAWSQSVIMANYTLSTRLELTNACHYAVKDIENHWTKTFKKTVHGTHAFYEGGC